MADDNKRKLYNALSEEYDMGTYEQFCKDLGDESKRRKLYDTTSEEYDYGSWDDFSTQLGYGQQAPRPEVPEAPIPTTTEAQNPGEAPTQTEAEPVQSQQQLGQASQQPEQAQPTYALKDIDSKNLGIFFKSKDGDFAYPAEAILPAGNVGKWARSLGEECLSIYMNIPGSAKLIDVAPDDYETMYQKGYRPFGRKLTEEEMQEYRAWVEERNKELEYMNSIEGQLASTNQRLKETETELKARGEALLKEVESNKPSGLMGILAETGEAVAGDRMGGATLRTAEDDYIFQKDKEYQALKLKLRRLEAQKKRLENAKSNRDNGDGFWKNFFRSSAQSLFNADKWDFGKSELRDAQTMLEIGGRIKEGAELTEAEIGALTELYLEQLVESQYGDLGSGDRWGTMAGESISFMKDFMLTGGFGKVGTKIPMELAKAIATRAAKRRASGWAGKKLALEIGEEGFKKAVLQGGKGAIKEAGAALGKRGLAATLAIRALGVGAEDLLIRAPLMSVTVQGRNLEADIIKTKLGEVVFDEETGELHFVDDTDWGVASWEASADRVIENFSEMWGGRILGVSDITRAFGARKLTAAILRATRENAGTILSKTSNLLRRASVNGYFGEVGEEYYGQVWRTMLNLDSSKDEYGNNLLTSGQFHGDIWGGMALSVGLTGAGAMALNYGIQKGIKGAGSLYWRNRVNTADKRAVGILGKDAWESMRMIIDTTDNEGIGQLAEQVVADRGMKEEERKAVLDYMEASMNQRGYNLGEILAKKAAEDKGKYGEGVQARIALDDALSNSFEAGYATLVPKEKNDVQLLFDHHKKRAEAEFDEAFLRELEAKPLETLLTMADGGFTPEQIDLANEFAHASIKRDGIIQRAKDEIESQISESNAEIDRRVNTSTGLIQTAIIGIENREAYIIDGKIEMTPSGGINFEESDESLIILDALTGKKEMISIKDIERMLPHSEPTKEKQISKTAIEQEINQALEDELNGRLAFNPGDVVTIHSNAGVSDVTIIGGAVDENGMPLAGMVTVQYEDGSQGAINTDALQQMADMANQDRLNDIIAQREALREQQRGQEDANSPDGSHSETNTPGDTPAAQRESRDGYPLRLNDEFTILDESGFPVRGSITAEIDEDGTIEIYTEEPLNGKKVNRLTPEEFFELVDTYNGQPSSNNEDNSLTDGEEDVTLQHGTGSGQDNDRADGADGYGNLPPVATDAAGGLAGNRDRSAIGVFEEGLESHRNAHSDDSERNRRRAESERLVEIAKENGKFFERKDVHELGDKNAKRTGESEVIVNRKDNKVYKIKDPYAKSPMKPGVAPEDSIYEHLVHNKYFPETAYGFEGISEDIGDARIVLSQEFIESAGQPTQEQIEAALAEKGLYPEGDGYYYGNDEIRVTDVTGDNAVLGSDGKVYFIDPIIDFKKPASEILDNATSSPDGSHSETKQKKNNQNRDNNGTEGSTLLDSNTEGSEAGEPRSISDTSESEPNEEGEGQADRGTGTQSNSGEDLDLAFGDEEMGETDNQGEETLGTEGEEGLANLAANISEAEKDVEQNPTEKQKLAGNYKKGHVKVGKFDVTIENPAGSVREGRDADGKEWRTTMQNTYGYIRGTKGVDGDHIDVYLSGDIEGWNGNTVVIIDQYNPDGTFDEHKVMLGFNSMEEAKEAYLSNYEEGWENGRRLVFTTADLADFEKWIESSHRKTKAYHEYKIAENGETQENPRILSESEAEALISRMKQGATVASRIAINDDTWLSAITTPLGTVKMGENQKAKLFEKGRAEQYGMILETLSNPDVVLEELDNEDNLFHERPSSYLFIKTFQKEDGSKYVHFESVTVSQEGLEVSISSHIIRENQLKNKMKSDRLLYKATALDESANSSAEQPTTEGGSLSSEGKGSEKVGDGQVAPEDKPKEPTEAPNKKEAKGREQAQQWLGEKRRGTEEIKEKIISTEAFGAEDGSFEKAYADELRAELEKREEEKKALREMPEYKHLYEALDELQRADKDHYEAMKRYDLPQEERDKLERDKWETRKAAREEADKEFDKLTDDELKATLEENPDIQSAFGRDGLMQYSRTADRLADIRRAEELQERWENTAELPHPSEGATAPKKVQMTDFTAPKNDSREILKGVYHDGENGMAISTDTHVLVASKDAYEASKAGKIVYGKGKNQREEEKPLGAGGYPNYLRVIPQGEAKATAPLTVRKIAEVEMALHEALKGLESKHDRENATVMVRMPGGQIVAFYAQTLEKFLSAARMLGNGTLEYWGNTRPMSVRDAKGAAIGMPIMLEKEPTWRIDFGSSIDDNVVAEPGRGYSQRGRSVTGRSLFDWRSEPGQQSLLDLMEAPEEATTPNTPGNNSKSADATHSETKKADGLRPGEDLFDMARRIAEEEKTKREKDRERRLMEAGDRADEKIDEFSQLFAEFLRHSREIDEERLQAYDEISSIREMAEEEGREATDEEAYRMEQLEDRIGELDREEDMLDEETALRREELEEGLYSFYRINNTENDARAISREKAQRVMAEVMMRRAWRHPENRDGVLSPDGSHSETKEGGANEGAGEVKTAGGVIRYEGTGHLPDAEQGEFAHAERVFTLDGNFDLTGSEKIKDRGDVAFLFKALESKAVEHVFAVFVKDGRPHVVHVSMGAQNISVVDNAKIRAGFDAFGADEVYLVHNHPSGNLKPSPQDLNFMSMAEGMFEGKAKVRGLIIDTESGRFSEFGSRIGAVEYERPKEVEKETPVATYNFDERKASGAEKGPKIMGPSSVSHFINGLRFENGNKLSYLILNNSNEIVGLIHTDYENIANRDLAEEIVSTAIKYNGKAAIVFGNGRLNVGLNSELKDNISQLSGKEIRLLDVMQIGGEMPYRSANEEGLMEPEAEYGGSEVRRNIENGIEALRRLKDGKEEVRNAMQREDLEAYGGTKDITFCLGTPGIPDKGYKKGYGILHIGAKHGPEAILRMLSIIAEGKIERYVPGNKTVVLTDGEYEAVLALTRNGQRQSWLLTGWDKLPSDENGKVSTNTVSTQANPTFSRDDLGAVIESSAKIIEKLKTDKEADKIIGRIKEKAAIAEVMADMTKATGVDVEIVTDKEAREERERAVSPDGSHNETKGVVCGYTKDGKIFLNEDAMGPDTPLHEYTHLWDDMIKRENPELWERGKELLKETPLWKEVKENSDYADIRDDEDAIASEVHSRLSGENGVRIMDDMVNAARKEGPFKEAEAVSLVHRIKRWLGEMFKGLKKTLGKWTKRDLGKLTLEDFNNMTLRDFAEGLDPNKEMRRGEAEPGGAYMFAGNKDEFERTRLRAIEEKGIVMPGLAEKEVEVVKVPRHDFRGSGEQARKEAQEWANENLKGTYTLIDSSGKEIEYTISGNAIKKYTSSSSSGKSRDLGTHLTVLTQLPEVIRSSMEAEVHPDYPKNNKGERDDKLESTKHSLIHRFYGAVDIDGTLYRVKTTIQEQRTSGNKPHSYEVSEIETLDREPSVAEPMGQGTHRTAKLVNISESRKITGRELLAGVGKSYQPGVKLLDVSPEGSHSETNRERAGRGAYTDNEVSVYNDLISRIEGKSRFSKKRQAEWAAKERHRMAKRIGELAEKLHIDNIEVITDLSQLSPKGSHSETKGKRASAKGFFNRRTGKITIVIPNHLSMIDAEQTLLHEAVAHYGLRKLFGEHFEDFLDNVYEAADPEIRRKITEMAAQNGWDFRTATEEYLAGLAETIDVSDYEEGVPVWKRNEWWGKIKRMFVNMLDKIGFKGFKDSTGMTLSDNELKYLLWISYQNIRRPGEMKSLIGEAENITKQQELKVGNYAEIGIEADYAAEPGETEIENSRFNEGLKKWESGEIRANEIIQAGHPRGVMKAFLPSKPIIVTQKVLSKSRKKHHLEATDCKDLPKALAEPIFVFKREDKKISALTLLKDREGRNIFVAVELDVNKQLGHEVLEVNDILTIHGREIKNIIDPIIENNTLKYVDKEKGLEWLSSAKLNSQAIAPETFDNATKLIKDFENPTIEEEELFRPGDFSPRDKVYARDTYERMVSKGSYQFQEAVQDSMLGLKKLYQAILGAQGLTQRDKSFRIEDVAGFENAYVNENTLSSATRAQQHEYFVRYMKPILEEIGKICGANDRKRRELTDYIMAKHGLERNEYMRNEAATNGESTDRDFAGLIGLTGEADWQAAEDVAKQWVDDYEAMYDTTHLWEAINRATMANLERVYKSGIISKDTFEKVSTMYQYYVPLRGWDETTSDEVYSYLTSPNGPLNGSIVKRAEGRESRADDPIATIGMMADDAIRQGNRNLMKQRFLNFVMNHPNDAVSVHDIWLEHDDVTDEWNPVFADIEETDTPEQVAQKIEDFENLMKTLKKAEPRKYKRGREAQNIPYKVTKGNLIEHQVLIKRNGQTFVATINGNPRAAQAINGITNPDVDTEGVVGNMLKAAQSVNRFLSSAYTTANPDFVISNFIRDTLYSNCMTWVKESPAYALNFHKNFGQYNPLMMYKLFHKWEHGTLDMSNRSEKLFYDFMINGGETGYTNIQKIEKYKKNIEKELKKQGNVVRKDWDIIAVQLEMLNRSVENVARFAAFVTSREMGRTIDRCIWDAKEVSVNFNKKGAGDKMMNSNGQKLLGLIGGEISGFGRIFEVFWNAGVQGMTNYGRAFNYNPSKAIAGASAMITLGVVIPMLAQMAGGGDGDDDDKNAYYNLPSYVRRSNICIKAGDQWITTPLPIEYRALYGIGELAYGVISGNERYSNSELAYEMAAQVSQILPLDVLEGQGGLHALIPSAVKPLVEAQTNTGWTGLPIYKDTPFNKKDPEWTKAYKSADKYLVGTSEWLNEKTGGDEFKKGFIDINPAKVEYLLNGYLGGYFSFGNKVIKSMETAFGDREFEWRNMPIANRVVKSGDERTQARKLQNEYFKYKDEYEETGRLLRKYENRADDEMEKMPNETYKETAESKKWRAKIEQLVNSPEYARWQVFDDYKPDIEAIRTEIATETDGDMKKQLEAEYYSLMREMIEYLHNPDKYLEQFEEE